MGRLTAELIKPIETWAYGCKFRSRLEARWSVFLTEAGVKWSYEPQGFHLAQRWHYLPDFWLPKQETWLEIKGSGDWRSEPDALMKVFHLAYLEGHRVIVMAGDLPYPFPQMTTEHYENGTAFFGNADEDAPYWFTQCEFCAVIGIEYAGRSDRLPCGCAAGFGIKMRYGFGSQRLRDAYAAARSARFEHGESPA